MKREDVRIGLVAVGVTVFAITWAWNIHRRVGKLEQNSALGSQVRALENQTEARAVLEQRVTTLA